VGLSPSPPVRHTPSRGTERDRRHLCRRQPREATRSPASTPCIDTRFVRTTVRCGGQQSRLGGHVNADTPLARCSRPVHRSSAAPALCRGRPIHTRASTAWHLPEQHRANQQRQL
jgi:hypothetical protein